MKEQQRLQKQIESLQGVLKNSPEGKLICCQNDQYRKCYVSINGKRRYLPKSEKELAEKLAVKKYVSYALEDLSREKRALEFYLKHHNPGIERAERLLEEFPGFAELLSPYFKSFSQELQDWVSEPYDRNKDYPEHLVHRTVSGNLVRSKSEAMIDLILSTNHIPFRYECALNLNGVIVYPDFTVRHPQTGEIFYWEHFGMMDDLIYCQRTASKLQLYMDNGIIPTIHLITTYENAQNPLTTESIQQVVEQYFL